MREWKKTEAGLLLECREETLTEAETERIRGMADEDDWEELDALMEEAQSIAVPKLLVQVLPIDEKGEDEVVLGGVRIHGALMRKNLEKASRVFPYVATCGTELAQWAKKSASDPLAEFWCDEIMKCFLTHAASALQPEIRRLYGIECHLNAMNPGSITDWPLTGQTQLFGMLGRETVREYTGVTLTDSMLMLPSKSISGFLFESDTAYQNCSRCPILRCPNRRAAPDADVETR